MIQAAFEEFIQICKQLAGDQRYACSVGGSLGKDTWDDRSDVDFRLFTDRTLLWPDQHPELWVDYFAAIERWKIRGLKIDGIWPRTVAEFDAALDSWLTGEIRPVELVWTIWGYHILTDIYNQFIIEDPYNIIAAWKERLSVYPPALKQAILDKYLASLRYWRSDYHYAHKVERGDVVFLAGWIDRLLRYCGEKDSYVEGLFIDECFASVRRQGGFFPVHSGNHEGNVRNQYRFVDNKFRCGQVNILLALTDVGPGDGGTLVIPGSHKSNFAHPDMLKPWEERNKMDQMVGGIEVNLKKGDALMFVDAMSHGASTRTNPGERRVIIFRYGPSWGNTRYGYRYSQELLDRLTPSRRKILEPILPRIPEKMALR